MFEILATDAAERDLTQIHDYLIGSLCNPQAWDNLKVKIRDAYQALREQPFSCAECRDLRLRQFGYRMCSLGAYLFVYRVEEAHSVVHVIRYFHGLQNYEVQL